MKRLAWVGSLTISCVALVSVVCAIELSYRLFLSTPDWKVTRIYSENFYQLFPEIGFLPSPNRKSKVTVYDIDDSLLYVNDYDIDGFYRRKTFRSKGLGSRESLLFFGCSYVFGPGVDDTQTLPSEFAKLEPSYRVYNYGVDAWGPGNILRRVQKTSLSAEVPEKTGRAIYVFLDTHISRLHGGPGLLKGFSNWRDVLPYYFLNSKGQLETDRMLSQARPVETRIFQWLSKSALFQYHNIDFPIWYRDSDFELLVQILRETRAELRKQVHVDDLYVLIYPHSKMGGRLIEYLKREDIPYLDYSDPSFLNGPEQSFYPNDWHPTAFTNRAVAKRISSDFKRLALESP